MELIDRRAVITALDEAKIKTTSEEYDRIIDVIGSMPTINRWIPVTERLPEEKLAVLVWCPQRKNIYCAYYDKRNANKVVYSEWFIFGAFNTIIDEDVVAWMPLPKPYEEGAEK